MKQLHCTGSLIRFLVTISTLSTLAVTDEQQFAFDLQNDYREPCKWNIRGQVSYRANCVCRNGNKISEFYLLNLLPSQSECIGNCILSLEGNGCDAVHFPMDYIMGICCAQCGGAHKNSSPRRGISCFEKPQKSASPTPSYKSNLSAVNSSLPPEHNGLVLQRNTRAILGDGVISKSLNSSLTVSGVVFITDVSFFDNNTGLNRSLASIYEAPFIINANYSYSPLEKATSSTDDTRYKCHAQQCGAQVTIYSKKDVDSHVIGAAMDKLRAETPNFGSVFVSNRKLVRILNNKNKKYAVFIPYKKFYLK